MDWRLRSSALLLAVLVLSAARPALAQDAAGAPPVSAPPSDFRSSVSSGRPYWEAGPVRPFYGVVFDTAGVGVETEAQLGYGRPHYMWVGLSARTGFNLRGLSLFTGLRAVAPWGAIRIGPRFQTTGKQRLIEPVDSVTRPLLEVEEGLKSKYICFDAEALFDIPLPYGNLGVTVAGYGVMGIPDELWVFEESLRIVIDPPFIGRGRLTYLAPIGNPATFRIGGQVEVLYNPGREYVNVRTGPAVAISLTHHLEAIAAASISVFNPDELGLSGADLGQIGLRYRWASGDLWPEFP